jgi:hypothetical protein
MLGFRQASALSLDIGRGSGSPSQCITGRGTDRSTTSSKQLHAATIPSTPVDATLNMAQATAQVTDALLARSAEPSQGNTGDGRRTRPVVASSSRSDAT